MPIFVKKCFLNPVVSHFRLAHGIALIILFEQTSLLQISSSVNSTKSVKGFLLIMPSISSVQFFLGVGLVLGALYAFKAPWRNNCISEIVQSHTSLYHGPVEPVRQQKPKISQHSPPPKTIELPPAFTDSVNPPGGPLPYSDPLMKSYAPTSYSLLAPFTDAHKYPAKVEETDEFLRWEDFQLPDKLAVHGLRLKNKMPQLGILLEPEKIKTGGTTDYSYWPQSYEPVFPEYVETGKLYDLPKECVLTAPRKEKGLRIFKVTYKDARTPVAIALFPFLGPYGSDVKDQCFPPNSKAMFTLGGKIIWDDKGKKGKLNCCGGYLQSYYPGGKASIPNWSDGTIDSYRSKASRRQASFGNYINGPKMVYSALDKFSPAGKHVLVVGSAPHPWLEGIALAYGASKITTSEYQVPEITGIKYSTIMSTIHHETLLMNPVQFDMIMSYSSLEHDGLGRYHDPIAPDADIQQLRNLYDLLKPGGHMILQVPLRETDDITMNEGRHYGPIRYPRMIAPFQLEAMYYLGGIEIKVGEDPNGGVDKVKTLKECFKIMNSKRVKKGSKTAADGRKIVTFGVEQCVSVLRRPPTP